MIEVKLREAILAYERRTGKRITYGELAKRTALSQATVEAIGSRPTYNATLGTIDKLCSALDCELTDLVQYYPDKYASKKHRRRRRKN